MGKLSAEERPVIGQLANEVRAKIEEAIEREQAELAQRLIAHKLQTETIDVTLPGQKLPLGKRHPLNTVLYELYDIFTGMGFSIAEGPEVELDYYNFEALNIPKNHPARDTQDTFYINDNIAAAHPDLPDADPHHGKAEAPHPCHRPRPCVPQRCSGCHPLPCVPPDRGPGGGQGHHHGAT